MQVNTPSKEGLSLELRRTYAHPADRVFKALIDPESIMRWFAPPGCEMLSVEADARPGGRYTIRMRKPGIEAYCVTGVYEEVRPNFLLKFTWQWVDLPCYEGETLVTIRLSESSCGTELELVQEGFRGEMQRDGHHQGWTGGLASLGQTLDQMKEEKR